MSEAAALRDRRLRALDVLPLRLRPRNPLTGVAAPPVEVAPAERHARAAGAAPRPARIRRLALQPDPAELADPQLKKMYTALTEAVSKAGLQAVRTCDVAADPSAAVLVFGAAPAPGDVPSARVLRADALAVLAGDRERKRALWERMRALGREGAA